MNPIKIAAVIALLTAACAFAYLIYQGTTLRDRYKASIYKYMECRTGRDAVEANWNAVQSEIELLKDKGQYKQAGEYEKAVLIWLGTGASIHDAGGCRADRSRCGACPARCSQT